MTIDLNAAISGDTEAWNALVTRYAPVVLAAASRVIGRAGAATATGPIDVEDIVQEVFIRLIRNDCRTLRRYDPDKAQMSTWLTIITRHVAIDHMRRKGIIAGPLAEAQTVAATPKSDLSGGGGVSGGASGGLPLHLLTDRQRLVLTLLFDDDRSVEEVARFLGVSEQTVRSTKHKAISRLREALQAKNSGDEDGESPVLPEDKQ